jgi:hypothetical protein
MKWNVLQRFRLHTKFCVSLKKTYESNLQSNINESIHFNEIGVIITVHLFSGGGIKPDSWTTLFKPLQISSLKKYLPSYVMSCSSVARPSNQTSQGNFLDHNYNSLTGVNPLKWI